MYFKEEKLADVLYIDDFIRKRYDIMNHIIECHLKTKESKEYEEKQKAKQRELLERAKKNQNVLKAYFNK